MSNTPENICALSLTQLSKAIHSREITSQAATEAIFQRIDEKDSQINAYVHLFREAALRQAQQADQEIAQNQSRGPLHGVPVAIKDMIDTIEGPTTMASPIYKDHVAGRNATVVDRLDQAGAILIGKLNMHQFAFGAMGDRSLEGPARNPHDLSKITGGSSSGSGAAVAADMAFATIGTDTGGSIRIPASCCGIVGMKPTFGTVSKYGVFPLSWTQDHIGPMTKTVADNATFLNVLAAHDSKDPYSLRRPEEDFGALIGQAVTGFRVGVPENYFFDIMEPEVQNVFDKNIKILQDLGVEIVPIQLPLMDELMAANQMILASDAYAVLGEHVVNQPENFDPEVLTRILSGAGVYASQYVRMLAAKNQIIEAHAKVMASLDAVITPTLCVLPFDIDQRQIDVQGVMHQARVIVRMTVPANLTGFPAISVPGGRVGALPVGIQMMGLPYTEGKLYQLAAALEAATDA